MTDPNPVYGNGATPVITLAGRAWPIPQLAIRQLRVITPALLKLMPWITELARAGKDNAALGTALESLDQVRFALVLDTVYVALTRAHPKLTRDEFEDMVIPVGELIAALPVIIRQTGVFTAAQTQETEPGEAVESHPIGTA